MLTTPQRYRVGMVGEWDDDAPYPDITTQITAGGPTPKRVTGARLVGAAQIGVQNQTSIDHSWAEVQVSLAVGPSGGPSPGDPASLDVIGMASCWVGSPLMWNLTVGGDERPDEYLKTANMSAPLWIEGASPRLIDIGEALWGVFSVGLRQGVPPDQIRVTLNGVVTVASRDDD